MSSLLFIDEESPNAQPQVCPMSYTSGMNDTNPAVAKLQRIQQLWAELGRTKLNSPEYRDVMKKIRALSAEYQPLVDAPQKGEKSK
ncbi:MAG TPA: hypothetical protein VIH75_20170 [Candidatus Sulfotelmatobacter sp.]